MMGKKRLVKITIIMAIALFLVSSGYCQFSQEDILSAAIKKANDLGYEIKEMNVSYDEGNKALKKHLKRIGVSVYNEKTGEWEPELPRTPEQEYPELAGRNYQAIYFGPKEMLKGGDLWVFIDKDTGKVISHIAGQ